MNHLETRVTVAQVLQPSFQDFIYQKPEVHELCDQIIKKLSLANENIYSQLLRLEEITPPHIKPAIDQLQTLIEPHVRPEAQKYIFSLIMMLLTRQANMFTTTPRETIGHR